MRIVIKNGTVVFTNRTEQTDLLIDGAKIVKIDSIILEQADNILANNTKDTAHAIVVYFFIVIFCRPFTFKEFIIFISF